MIMYNKMTKVALPYEATPRTISRNQTNKNANNDTEANRDWMVLKRITYVVSVVVRTFGLGNETRCGRILPARFFF